MNVKDLLAPIKEVEKAGKLDVASRLQQRTACVMRYTVQNGIINYNPVSDLTDAVSTSKVRHHPALDLNLIPNFLERVDDFKGCKLTQLAVKLALLLFTRSSELRFARWDELTCITPRGPFPPSANRSLALSILRAVRRYNLHIWRKRKNLSLFITIPPVSRFVHIITMDVVIKAAASLPGSKNPYLVSESCWLKVLVDRVTTVRRAGVRFQRLGLSGRCIPSSHAHNSKMFSDL